VLKLSCEVTALLLLGSLLISPGCASNSIERTLYETAQSIRVQECAKDRSSQCEERQSYDAYQRERGSALSESENP
jgi:hypothetical protein